ncbi:hypothetical protein NA78x_004195 [Anatilimnocola sp. NA78]|uniref:hypothetical protein n=1 Tax=Anatilimnocola sp. NA78 TaxID=3415683 RepID=UPI003CE58185
MTQAREAAAQPNSLFRGWGSACAIFVTCTVLATGGSFLVANLLGGERIIVGAMVACALCWGAALLGLMLILGGKVLGQGFGATLFAMMIRLAMPLGIAVYLTEQSPFWGEAMLLPFLLGNYFVALIAETALAIKLLGGESPFSNKPAAKKSDPATSELAGGKLAP